VQAGFQPPARRVRFARKKQASAPPSGSLSQRTSWTCLRARDPLPRRSPNRREAALWGCAAGCCRRALGAAGGTSAPRADETRVRRIIRWNQPVAPDRCDRAPCPSPTESSSATPAPQALAVDECESGGWQARTKSRQTRSRVSGASDVGRGWPSRRRASLDVAFLGHAAALHATGPLRLARAADEPENDRGHSGRPWATAHPGTPASSSADGPAESALVSEGTAISRKQPNRRGAAAWHLRGRDCRMRLTDWGSEPRFGQVRGRDGGRFPTSWDGAASRAG
jgi:hypothetical protein